MASRIVAIFYERIVNLVPRMDDFTRNSGILSLGTLAGQAIAALALPILTRLYNPTDFEALAIYISILSITSAVSCLKLEIAIPIPEKDAEAVDLLVLCLVFAALFTIVSAVAIYLFPLLIIDSIGNDQLTEYLWIIPVGIWVSACYAALQYWNSRRKRFSLIAITRLSRSLIGVGTQISLGVFQVFTSAGLLAGHLLYCAAGILGLSRSIWQNDRSLLSSCTVNSLVQSLIRFKRFIIYCVPENLFNMAGIHVPIILIAGFAGNAEAGFLLLAMRIMAIPVGLIGSSVAQVYLVEAPNKLRDGNLYSFTIETTIKLIKVGTLPLLLIGLFSPMIFPYIFGAEWGRAGMIALWLTPVCLLQFVVVPVSMVLIVMEEQGWAAFLQLIGFLFRVGILSLAIYVSEPRLTELYAITGAIFYVVYLFVVFYFARKAR
jgi:O-antigen/teichoic acid export membrane protein